MPSKTALDHGYLFKHARNSSFFHLWTVGCLQLCDGVNKLFDITISGIKPVVAVHVHPLNACVDTALGTVYKS